MRPTFSVIIPTYNRESLVGPTLDSVAAQDLDDYEVIAVDDGSTDGTIDVVRGHPLEVRVVEQDHKGCAAARNRGAAEARGEYLAFLDSDDLWFPWTLSVFKSVILSAGAPTFVGGALHHFRDRSELDSVAQVQLGFDRGPDFFSTALQSGFDLGVAHGVVRRDRYVEVGGCEERDVNGTDSDVLMKLGVAPGCAIVRSPVTLAYRVHGGRTTVNLEKGLAGAKLLIGNEREGLYPGGPERRRERMANVYARVRGISRTAASGGRPDIASWIYGRTFVGNVALGRVAYLLAMPPIVVGSWIRLAVDRGIGKKTQ